MLLMKYFLMKIGSAKIYVNVKYSDDYYGNTI